LISKTEPQPVSAPEEAGTETTRKRAVIALRTGRGVFYAAAGQGLLFGCSLVGGVILARLLSPRDFGIYAISAFVAQKLSLVSDIGLSAKLIHDQNPPTLRQQRAVFTLNFLVALAVYSALFVLVPWIAPLFRLEAGAIRLIRALGVLILLAPVRLIPVATLSRRLRYDRLTLEEIASGITFQTVAVVLAYRQFSYWSFGFAALATVVVRVLVLYGFAGWKVGIAWDSAYLKKSAKFGGQFQITWFLTILRENLITFVGGPLFGPTAVGLLNWGLRLASICSQELVNLSSRVSFPSLSRMRSEPAFFDAALSKTLRYLNLAGICVLSVTAGLAPKIVHFVFTDKWLPALPLFYAFAVRMVALSFTTVFDLGLKAQGKPGSSVKIAFIWTPLEFALAVLAGLAWGYPGIALATIPGAWLAAALYWREMSKFAAVPFASTTATPLVCGIATFGLLRYFALGHATSLPALAGAGLLGLSLYAAMALALEGGLLWRELRGDAAMLLKRRGGQAAKFALQPGGESPAEVV
jgi:O-antigen/teichoic acid export membrane protein